MYGRKQESLSIDYTLLLKHSILKIPIEKNYSYMNLFFTNQINVLYWQKLHCVLVVVKNKIRYYKGITNQ